MYENVKVNVNGAEISQKEIEQYIAMIEKKHNRKIASINIEADGDFVNCSFKYVPVAFERIRRITGYLTGTVDSWNNAKKCELNDRVKHGTELEAL